MVRFGYYRSLKDSMMTGNLGGELDRDDPDPIARSCRLIWIVHGFRTPRVTYVFRGPFVRVVVVCGLHSHIYTFVICLHNSWSFNMSYADVDVD